MKKPQGLSRVFKKSIWGMAWGGVIFCMLFGLIGCGTDNGPGTSPETKVQSYLEEKYNESFEIAEFSRKSDGGPFRDSVYTGTAFAKKSPALLFDIWGAKDLKSFEDSYFLTGVMPEIDTWLSSKAKGIWKDCKVRDQVTLLEYRGEPSYNIHDAEAFFDNEFARSSIYLYLPEKTKGNLSSMVWEYMQEIQAARSGILYIYLVDEQVYESLNLYAPSSADDDNSTFSVSLGADRTSVENALR